jgi:hypothetical protein
MPLIIDNPDCLEEPQISHLKLITAQNSQLKALHLKT